MSEQDNQKLDVLSEQERDILSEQLATTIGEFTEDEFADKLATVFD